MFEISLSAYNDIVEVATNSVDAEICGVLIGKEELGISFIEIENVSKDLKVIDYVMSPNQLMSILRNTQFLNKASSVVWNAIVHSHPNNTGHPSSVDLGRAEYNVIYFIYGLADNILRAWSLIKDDNGHKFFTSKEYKVI